MLELVGSDRRACSGFMGDDQILPAGELGLQSGNGRLNVIATARKQVVAVSRTGGIEPQNDIAIRHPVAVPHQDLLDDTAFSVLDRFAIGQHLDRSRRDNGAGQWGPLLPSRQSRRTPR